MIKTVDTSYYIINNKEKKELFIYYDSEHKLDCNMNILTFQLNFNLKDIDIDNDNKDEIIEQYFKDNWARFFMVKSVPYGDLMSIGISFEQILNMVNEIAKSKIIFEDYKSI